MYTVISILDIVFIIFHLFLTNSYYNNKILLGSISKLYKIHGTNIIKAITIGNKIVQQKDINWSNRIRGKLALAQMKIKIIIQDLRPNIIPQIKPSYKGLNKRLSFLDK
jgi:hypothetical protein